MRRLALAVTLLLCAAAPASAANPWIQKRAPLNIAHQGGEDEFPSNTLYAFRKAVRAGADMLELDIGVTKDGKVIVMHDTTVDGKTNGHGTVASKTLAQIRRLDAAYWFAPAKDDHYGHDHPTSAYRLRGIATGRRPAPKGFTATDFRVPTLSEVMRAFPHTPINVEIKGRTPKEDLSEYLQNANVLARSAEAHAAARPDRRLVQAGGGRALPQARPADRHRPGHRRLRRLADREVTRRRRGRLPGADHLRVRQHAARHHHRRERRARPHRGLRLAELVRRRRPRRPGHVAQADRHVRGRHHDVAPARLREGAAGAQAPEQLPTSPRPSP